MNTMIKMIRNNKEIKKRNDERRRAKSEMRRAKTLSEKKF